jgi:maltose alpha-D-glucosyltransferase/alpha-amylase
MTRRNGEAVLLGEVNLPYPELMPFFGGVDGGNTPDELTMCFDFVGMQQMYLALARGDAEPLAEALRQRPNPPADGHWATFVRNHDELTLDKLTESQRKEVFDAFGPDEDMQLYGRGLRRRLPGMLDGDQRRMRMVYSLLFSLPGTPVLFYGEEIGMVEDLELPGRFAVRSDMDWAAAEEQRRDQDSLLNWMRRMIECYRECPELAWGSYTVLDPGPQARPVLAHRSDCDGATVVALHNFGDSKVSAAPVLAGLAGRELHDVLDPTADPVTADDEGRIELDLGPYGYRWLRANPEPS